VFLGSGEHCGGHSSVLCTHGENREAMEAARQTMYRTSYRFKLSKCAKYLYKLEIKSTLQHLISQNFLKSCENIVKKLKKKTVYGAILQAFFVSAK
jgi:hypothetical protein